MLELVSDLAARALDAVTHGSPGALLALFFVSALTELGVPFPFLMDTVLFFSGFQTGPASSEVLRIMLALLLGREAGAAAIYWLSRVLGKAFLGWSERRFPPLKTRVAWLVTRLCGSGNAPWAVAIARLTPGLLTPSSVVSGAMCLPYFHFFLGIALSSVIADAALIVLGFSTKHGLTYLGFTPSPWHVFVGVIAAIIIFWVVRRFVLRRVAK